MNPFARERFSRTDPRLDPHADVPRDGSRASKVDSNIGEEHFRLQVFVRQVLLRPQSIACSGIGAKAKFPSLAAARAACTFAALSFRAASANACITWSAVSGTLRAGVASLTLTTSSTCPDSTRLSMAKADREKQVY